MPHSGLTQHPPGGAWNRPPDYLSLSEIMHGLLPDGIILGSCWLTSLGLA